jgi:DNA-binding response OmpR family regulator
MNNADIRILLVDDDEMIRDCVGAYLEDEGFGVYSAASAEEALKSIAAISPAVCISDMRLPGMNGEEFISMAYTLVPATVYLLHTGMLYTLSDELRAIGMTPDDVLLKPIHDLSRLVNKIKHSAAGRKL